MSLTGYGRVPRVPRIALLLVQECASARALHLGELCMLFPGVHAEAVCALRRLAREAKRADERGGNCPNLGIVR